MDVPFLDLPAQNAALRDEILSRWSDLVESAGFINGPSVAHFEAEFAAACGTNHVAAVSNGTDALRLAFNALGVKPGDEIVTVANTFIATVEAISHAGARPVLVDVRSDTYNMDPDFLDDAITSRTVGIVPVHLYGQTAEMDPILEIAGRHGLWVVEDAAQAHLAEYKGRRAGSMGVAAAFSFYPGKNLGACGDAGAVTTRDDALAARVRMLRDHGQAAKYHHEIEGYNNRCDATQAAALSVKLKHLPQWNEARRRNAARYFDNLRDVQGVTLPRIHPHCLSNFHLFVVLVEQRERVIEALHEAGIGTGLHYPIPIHLQKAYSRLGLREGSYPVAEAAARKLLSLPMFPELTFDQIDYVCRHLEKAISP